MSVGPVSTAIAAELIVVLCIFIGAATWINYGAIVDAVRAWGAW